MPPPTMIFPDDIPAITVAGTPITEECFPRRKQRRFMPDQDWDLIPEFSKRHEDHLDYSVDMHRVLDEGEYVICASAWSNDPSTMPVTSVHYAQKGALVFVHSGTELTTYMVTLLVRTNRHRVFTYRLLIQISRHAFDTLADYAPPLLLNESESCGCNCNFFVDLLDEYVGPFYYDATEAGPLFACIPIADGGGGGGGGEGPPPE